MIHSIFQPHNDTGDWKILRKAETAPKTGPYDWISSIIKKRQIKQFTVMAGDNVISK